MFFPHEMRSIHTKEYEKSHVGCQKLRSTIFFTFLLSSILIMVSRELCEPANIQLGLKQVCETQLAS